MDLYCPKCGEPWDFDCLHDEVAERRSQGLQSTYETVSAQFRSQGCEALKAAYDGRCNPFGLTRAEAASALYDLLGDDMDGAAAMLDDLGF